MPNIGNHVDAIFLPESVNTSTKLRVNDGDGSLLLGDITSGTGTTDSGMIFDHGTGSTTKGGLFTEVDGKILSYGINVEQIDTNYDSTRAGGIFRLDSRTTGDTGTGDAFSTHAFHILGRGEGETDEYTALAIDLNTGNTSLATEKGSVGIGTGSPISVNLQINGFYNSGTSEYGAPTQYFLTTLSSPSAGDNIGRIIFARNGDSATIAAKSTGTANETDLYFYNRTSGGADNVNNVQNTTPTLKLYHDKTAEFASDVNLPDDAKLLLGTDDDFQIYYDGGTAHIDNDQGQIRMRAASAFLFYYEGNSGVEDYAKFKQNGEVELYHDGILAFETTSTGIDVPLGTITGPATLNIDPAAVGDNTGTVVIKGDLQVDGTTTTINSTTLTVDDLNIVLASGATNAAAADGAGITIDGANQTFIYESAADSFKTSTRLGIRATPNINSNFRIGGNAGGEGNGATYYAFLNNPVFQSDITTVGYYNFVQVKTGANSGTAYTISNIEGYTATVGSGTVNADSTITNLTGFNVKSSWTEGTNNYGFRGNIDAAANTNRWNVYMEGTAPNYFAGNVGIGTDNPTELLHLSSDSAHGILLERGGASPSEVKFANEGNYAVISNNTNGISFETGSTPSQVMLIKANGNVGIGTDNPSSILHIAGNNSTQEIKYGHNSTGYFLSNTEVNRSGADQAIHVYHYRWNGTKVAEMKVLTGDDTTNKDNGYFTFETASSGTPVERVRIDANGNVGIGTDNPGYTLQVDGDVGITNSSESDLYFDVDYGNGTTSSATIFSYPTRFGIKQGGNSRADNYIFYYYQDASTAANDYLYFEVGDNERVRITGDGKVNITTDTNNASPAASGDNLVIKDSDGCGMSILSGDGNSQNIYLGSVSDNDGVRLEGFYNSGSPYFNIYTGGTERLRITSDGNVGIGTNNPGAKLDVRGVANIVSAASDPVLNITSNSGYIRDVSDGTGDGGHGILQMAGPDSSYVISVQDGVGRIQHRWNSSTGSSPTFLVAGENAAFWEMDASAPTTELFVVYNDDGTGKLAGDTIGWNKIFNVGTDEIAWGADPDTATTTSFNRWKITNDQDTTAPESGNTYMQLKGNSTNESTFRLRAGSDDTVGSFSIDSYTGGSWDNVLTLLPSDKGSATYDPAVLRLNTYEPSATATTSPGDAYGAIEFSINQAEINDNGGTAQTLTDNVIAAIKAIDWRNSGTTNEDAGIGFYTTQVSVASPALTFRGGFSNDGGFHITNDPNQANSTGKLHIKWDRESQHPYGFHLVQTTDNGEPDAVALTNMYDRDIGIVLRTGDGSGANQANRWYIWNDGAVATAANNNRFNISSGGDPTSGLTILQNNNVGINKAVPTESLDVNGVAQASLLVDAVYLKETWPAGNNTLAGNDLGTWTLTDGDLVTASTSSGYYIVDTANLPNGLSAITWQQATGVSDSYLTSPSIDVSNLRTNKKLRDEVSDSGNAADRSVADSRIYMTALLAAQSQDSGLEYLEVDLSSDDGTTWVKSNALVWQDNDPDSTDITDTTWRKIVIDISDYCINATFKVRFHGTGGGTGDSYGVSNIYIHEAPIPTNFQAKHLHIYNSDGTLAEFGRPEDGNVAITLNDGHGNANVCFNHTEGVAGAAGSSGRIRFAVDETTASAEFYLFDNVTAGSTYSPATNDSTGNYRLKIKTDEIQVGTTSNPVNLKVGNVISMVPYDNLNNGTLSFEGSAGQLFSITNNLATGSIFSVNDISGIPSIDVDANGTVSLAPFGGNVGIGKTNPSTTLDVDGTITGTTKNFSIPHPTKPEKRLVHSCLEGPENGVYVRGKLTDSTVIELPEYWTGLVHEDSITVTLTPIGSANVHYIVEVTDNRVVIGSESGTINCYFSVFGERKDVERLVTEVPEA